MLAAFRKVSEGPFVARAIAHFAFAVAGEGWGFGWLFDSTKIPLWKGRVEPLTRIGVQILFGFGPAHLSRLGSFDLALVHFGTQLVSVYLL